MTERPLPYPLDRGLSLSSDTPNESIGNYPFTWSTDDNTQRVTVTMELSLDEYTKLSSCVDIGSDIGYGADAIYIWWLWVKALNTMPLCEQIIECIENNDTVADAIRNASNDTSGIPVGGEFGDSTGLVKGAVDSSNILALSACTADNQYAVAVAIVDIAFDAIEQLFQLLELATNPTELVAETADNAPAILSGAPATAMDWMLWVQETAYEAWLVYDSIPKRNEIACEIFCIMQDNECSISFDELANYFYDRTPINIVGKRLDEILLDMITYTVPDAIGDMGLALFFSLISLGSKIVGYTGRTAFLATIHAFIDETNNNWIVNCDPCDPSVPFDQTLNFTPANASQFNLLLGQQNANALAVVDPDRKVIVEVEFAATEIHDIYVKLCRSNTRGASLRIIGYNGAVVAFDTNLGQPFVGCPQNVQYNIPDQTLTKLRVEYYWNWLGDAVYSLRLIGFGIPPF